MKLSTCVATVALASLLSTPVLAAEPFGKTVVHSATADQTRTAPKGLLPMLRKAPREADSPLSVTTAGGEGPQVIGGGSGNGRKVARNDSRNDRDIVRRADLSGPRNYGQGNLNTIYHYSDRLIDAELMDNDPVRQTGWLLFTGADGGSYRCTASMISRSIAVTAGHCLHQGGDRNGRNRANGWARNVRFAPAFTAGVRPFGEVTANWIGVTAGWYNAGGLDQGYDVGIVVLNKRTSPAPAVEIGTVTGWYGFCYQNCLQPYWHVTQHGYPGNYAGGLQMAEGTHLSRSDGRDFVSGSGMQGGSSGGPHLSNVGSLTDATANKGQAPGRNVVLAVTSWGYISDVYKIQGASPLSGPNNSNDFRSMFNTACTRARTLHGTASCALLP